MPSENIAQFHRRASSGHNAPSAMTGSVTGSRSSVCAK